jgi:hypothetical protein
VNYLHGEYSEGGLGLVIVGDGYGEAELEQFRFDAGAAAQTILGTPPFGVISLCIARIDVASGASSAFQSLAGGRPPTRFGAHAYPNDPHLLWIDEDLVMATVRAAVPAGWRDYKILVLVNAPEIFGGGGKFLAGAGGQVTGIAVVSNANGRETLMHELGHAFGLADEDPSVLVMSGSPPNVAASVDALPAFWRARLTPHVERPTTGNDRDVVGAFSARGGRALYRPQYSCIMKTASSLDCYCKVCAAWIETSLGTTSPERKAVQ